MSARSMPGKRAFGKNLAGHHGGARHDIDGPGCGSADGERRHCAANPDLPRWKSRAMFSAMQPVTERLRNFLQYVAVKLIDDPGQAQLKVAELAPKKVRFKLVLAKEDVAMLIGRNGFTASAIRSVLKAAAEREGVQISLQIHSHEEEAELLARSEGH
jgi:predicted RNA-binding protein YlqC (UPF0109 family)